MPRSSSGSEGDVDLSSRHAKRQRVRRQALRKKDMQSEDIVLDKELKKKLDREARIRSLWAADETDLGVEEKFQAAIETDEIRQRIQERLVHERAQMESAVEAKIAEERRVQLQRKRKEQEQRLKDQAELERILEENQKKLDKAKAKQTESEDVQGGAETATVQHHNLDTVTPGLRDTLVNDDVFILGK